MIIGKSLKVRGHILEQTELWKSLRMLVSDPVKLPLAHLSLRGCLYYRDVLGDTFGAAGVELQVELWRAGA